MKSQVGLGRLYPDGRFDRPPEAPREQAAEASKDTAGAPADPAELLSVVVHVDKAAFNELLEKASHP